ncbi:MAG: phenylacetate-CoA oxygenase subunit PaaJ [Bacteroidia bacterium]|nr:phenylacetate-CoA oxygenase subunit PaaJ [Bacteroidia bacterium]
MKVTPSQVLAILAQVKDPEIPVLSVVDLGVVEVLDCESEPILVELVPTFAGCPALEMMKTDVEKALTDAGIIATVVINRNKTWSSNRISEAGKEKIRQFGLAPPPVLPNDEFISLTVLQSAQCPVCYSTDTVLINPFGPTSCRSVHHCNKCHETFEQFKPL